MPRPPVRLASFDTHLECPVFNATFPYHVAMLRGQKLQSHHKQKVVAFRQFAEHVARTSAPYAQLDQHAGICVGDGIIGFHGEPASVGMRLCP